MVNDDRAFLLSLVGIFLVAVRHVLDDKLTVTVVILRVFQDTGQSNAARGQRVGQRLQGEADLRSEAVIGGTLLMTERTSKLEELFASPVFPALQNRPSHRTVGRSTVSASPPALGP